LVNQGGEKKAGAKNKDLNPLNPLRTFYAAPLARRIFFGGNSNAKEVGLIPEVVVK
jgi:hypothetical protein